MARVVSYCRVSSDDQAERDISIPAQRKAIERYIEELGHDLLEAFVDEGESAYTSANKRPGFMKMVSFCRQNKVELILVHKLDRFSRNREESILFKGLLRKHGVTVKSITENYDPETPQGFLYEGMIEVINQFYSMNLSTETMKGQRENAERGNRNGGGTPYGYRVQRTEVNGRERRSLVPGPEQEVAIVQEIFQRATEDGMGCLRIADDLNRRAIPAPNGLKWSTSSVSHILTNRAYLGELRWGLTKVRAGKRVAVPADKQIACKDAHVALVSEEIFMKYKVLAETRSFSEKQGVALPTRHLLGRVIRCGHCGNYYVGRKEKYKVDGKVRSVYPTYACGGLIRRGRSTCSALSISARWIEGEAISAIKRNVTSPVALMELERRVRDRLEAKRREVGNDPRYLERKMADIDRRIQNYYRAIGDGLDPHVCQQHIRELTERKQKVEEEIAAITADDYIGKALEANLRDIRSFADRFEQGFDSLGLEAQRRILHHFIASMEVVDRTAVKIVLRVPIRDGAGKGFDLDDDGGPGAGGGGSRRGGTRESVDFSPLHGASFGGRLEGGGSTDAEVLVKSITFLQEGGG